MRLSTTTRYLLAATLALAALATAAPNSPPLPDLRGHFIVKLRPGFSAAIFTELLDEYNQSGVENVAANAIHHTYDTALNGFAGKFSDAFLDTMRAQHGAAIEYIVPDGIATRQDEPATDGSQSKPAAWGLIRTSQRKLDLSADYHYPSKAGAGVDVWVVDTGVYATHTDFGGRASMVASFVTGEDNSTDLNGHGTHCSGTIASDTYGIAKKANIKGVKVLSRWGSGSWSGCISGVDLVAKNVRKGKTVMSMSLGGGLNQAMNDAVTNAVKAGVVAVIAAGNNGGDTCSTSPASAAGAIAVAASDNTDKMASFSNRGKCTHITAPGVNVLSLWYGADGKTNTISGTSMACPHVAGVVALLMAEKDYESPEEVKKALEALATRDAISNMPAETPNLLLYNGAGVAL